MDITPVKWISMKRTWSSQFEMMRKESNNTMPPEEMKEWNGMNEGKQDLEGARLQQMLERSCRKIHNEKNNTREMNKVENTPLEKRNKEEQLRATLRLKRKCVLQI